MPDVLPGIERQNLALCQTDRYEKVHDGLIALAKNHLGEDPLSGQLFVFFNRPRNRVKVLYFDRSGYCIWMKRLETGRFHFNPKAGDKQALSWTRLKLILEGIELDKVTTRKRFMHALTV